MYFRLQLSGTIAGIEAFSVNPVFDVEGELTENWDQPTANAMIDAAGAVQIPPMLLRLASERATFTELRLEGRSSATDALIGVAVGSYTGTQPPSSEIASKTPQAAVVLSLRTDNPGGSGRGRLFWPALGASLSTQMRLANPDPPTVAAEAATYLNGLQAAMQTAASGAFPPWASLRLAVRSKTKLSTAHVVRVMVGDVVDTQRRRRDALPENYSTSPYPPA